LRKAIIDSGPLINLTYLGLALKLSNFFNLIYVPSNVQTEVNRKHGFRRHLKKLYLTRIFQRCGCADPYNVELLTRLTPALHKGEAEAIAQAQERDVSVVIIDEEKGRKHVASMKNLTAVGTIGILARLHLEGHAGDPRELIAKLRRDRKFRVTDEIVNDAISKAGIPI